MMRRLWLLSLLHVITMAALAQNKYDIVVVGANPGGITAAIAAARMGEKVLVLERTHHIGGLPANGLGATDIDTRGATTGLFLEFVQHIKSHYIKTYGENSQQVKDCREGYHFEPSVAEQVFLQMIAAYPDITVLKRRQFDALDKNVKIRKGLVSSIQVTNRDNGKIEHYTAAVFIDGTYEGDLAAAAGIPFRVGRESRKAYGETGAGKIYKYWEGPEIAALSTREGDTAIQAYNYRVNLTKVASKRIPFERPANYNREEYISLITDVLENRQQAIGPMKHGIDVVVNSVLIPNGKVDANNQHAALISTDLPEENYRWPKAGWAWRDKFAERLRSYILGLLYFAANDPALPAAFRAEVNEWGLASDEYQDNQHFPRQVYVREGRRIIGKHIFTANDALAVAGKERPPLYRSSITAGHYSLDSHATLKREAGKPVLEGFLSYKTQPYTVPIEVMFSEKIKNVLCPVPVSGTHIGFSTLRMEPCWMALGQAAGVTAALMQQNRMAVQDIPVLQVQQILLEQQATLIYFSDLTVKDPDFKMVQLMGLQGYLPDYKARLDDPADAETIRLWEGLSGKKLQQYSNGGSRRSLLKQMYHNE
ncbi:FAD-dependent oxidoreductase [Pedobacter sp. MR2016-24]|uniref:FAD-dependent oxidoreductase n=1 Tax=Pedobacter sp. MR2016-24 TaxID=2994466 RepID=UPI00224508DD|nr:FAD-dependent oxidoreductase [Pedobacter sp. MR2016-24]MCX2486206.1 FAD-dependent oxidoreductase [Pedobacter sp. MR2016-24]